MNLSYRCTSAPIGQVFSFILFLLLRSFKVAMHPNTPYTFLQRLCETEGIPFKGIHSFRHFVATQAINSGIDIKSVSAMLGHSKTSTTLNIYTHAIENSNSTAIDCIADLLA